METTNKNAKPVDKKVWENPELELISIQSGIQPGGIEGNYTVGSLAKYDGVS